MDNYFNFGSLNYLIVEADKVDDILYVMRDRDEFGLAFLKIIVKPNYDIDAILEFIREHVALSTTYEIIVEENYELLEKEN